MQTDEYVPQTMPTISGSVNSRMELTPRRNSMNTMINVVSEVSMLLVNVCVMLIFTSSSMLCFAGFVLRFSRMRSKMTIVALIE